MYPTFNRIKKRHQLLFALLIATGFVSFWRGMWGIMDVLILPENYALSSAISLCVGILILLATHVLIKAYSFD